MSEVLRPTEGTVENSLTQQFRILYAAGSPLREIKRALFTILEKYGNEDDCFWISHTWAETLIAGRQVPKPKYMDVEVRHTFAEGYFVSYGAERYMVT